MYKARLQPRIANIASAELAKAALRWSLAYHLHCLNGIPSTVHRRPQKSGSNVPFLEDISPLRQFGYFCCSKAVSALSSCGTPPCVGELYISESCSKLIWCYGVFLTNCRSLHVSILCQKALRLEWDYSRLLWAWYVLANRCDFED